MMDFHPGRKMLLQAVLIGNCFRPSGTLARSLKLEAVISMPGRFQMGLCESSTRHFVVRGGPPHYATQG